MPAPEVVRQLAKRFEEDKERVKREIESTDRAIDRLVYELSHKGMKYGLREDEIRIVEGQ